MSRQSFGSSAPAGGQLSSSDYELFRRFLEEACGILLGDNKQYLVASRLSKIMKLHQINGLSELVDKMKLLSNRALKDAVVDAMTTNETLWFRDSHPFELFKNKIIPDCMITNKGRLRVWSAACSSGQEPFSLSMMLDEFNASKPSSIKPGLEIIATDLSQSMLDRCKSAEYDGLSLGRGLSEKRLKQFFEPLDDSLWRVRQEQRNRIRFQMLNLMDFSSELKKDILKRMHATLKPGGYLVLGASEGVTGLSDYFEMIHCHPGIIYRAL